jgi:hypothetical protein
MDLQNLWKFQAVALRSIFKENPKWSKCSWNNYACNISCIRHSVTVSDQSRSHHSVNATMTYVLPIRRLLNWGSKEHVATLVGSAGRRACFIVHRENTQLLGLDVCFQQLLSQHKQRENEGVITIWAPILQIRQTWHDHLQNKTWWGKYLFSEWTAFKCRTSLYIYIYIYLPHGTTSSTTPHSSQVFSAGEWTVQRIARHRK